VGPRTLAGRECGFKSCQEHGCLSLVSVVCCQVEVSATGRSLVQRSPTDCGGSECHRAASIMRTPCSTGGCCAMECLALRPRSATQTAGHQTNTPCNPNLVSSFYLSNSQTGTATTRHNLTHRCSRNSCTALCVATHAFVVTLSP